jgi:putative SOS response-associated peptidase YedK
MVTMCGRTFRISNGRRIREQFAITDPADVPDDYPPSWNIAPTTIQPVVRLSRDTHERELVPMRWGLVPYWAKDMKSLGLSTLNAQAETLMSKAIWRGPLERRRCLVPADGYYEWKKLDAKNRQPYAFARADGRMMAFAGLWDKWKAPDGTVLQSYSVITCDPNELAAEVHTRMPAILDESRYAKWLDPEASPREVLPLLRPFDADAMKMWPVGKNVGNVKNDSPELLVPLGGDEPGQGCLF